MPTDGGKHPALRATFSRGEKKRQCQPPGHFREFKMQNSKCKIEGAASRLALPRFSLCILHFAF
jgi:hypothetical protein